MRGLFIAYFLWIVFLRRRHGLGGSLLRERRRADLALRLGALVFVLWIPARLYSDWYVRFFNVGAGGGTAALIAAAAVLVALVFPMTGLVKTLGGLGIASVVAAGAPTPPPSQPGSPAPTR